MEYWNGSDASFGSWACGSEASYGTMKEIVEGYQTHQR
jgi:hypothetical protein